MILSDVLSNEEKELAVVANMRKKMEQKRDQAEQNLQALQKLKEQSDVFLFFKVSSGIVLFSMDLPVSQPGDLSENHTNDISLFFFFLLFFFFFFAILLVGSETGHRQVCSTS